MVTLPEEEIEETKADQAESVVREVLSGDPGGAVIRPILYIITGILIILLPQAAIIPLLLLALSEAR